MSEIARPSLGIEKVRIVLSFGIIVKQLPTTKVNEKGPLRKRMGRAPMLRLDPRPAAEGCQACEPRLEVRGPLERFDSRQCIAHAQLHLPFLPEDLRDLALGEPEAGRLFQGVDVIFVVQRLLAA